jgi:O-antigen/teichoic acid export membrane protein
MTARLLGPVEAAPLSALWACVYLVGPGLFLPLEQEMSARASGGGADPRRLLITALAAIAVAWTALAIISGPLSRALFDGQRVFVVCFAVGLAGCAAQHLVRGWLSAAGRFRRYGVLVAAEGGIRLAGGLVAALAGSRSASVYALVIGVSPLVCVLVAFPLRSLRFLWTSPVRWTGTRALGLLLASSFGAQFVLNVPPVAAGLLAPNREAAAVSRLLALVLVVEAPLFLFSAVQAAMLPRLTWLVAEGPLRRVHEELARIVAASALAAGALIAGSVAFGPSVVGVLFGDDFVLPRHYFGVMAVGSAAYMLALALAQGLIALNRRGGVAAAWSAAVVALIAVTAWPAGLLDRVSRGFAVGCVVALVAMAVQVITSWRHRGELPRPARGR